ncbi:hypothetical protein BP00DRAFT_181935 [Aspergillus indologenus CBS 114.80]|uniref:Uncharacterized protein n=1 Tax=Aspergillus indologenus CBS 114.80 TaxID=1450541 RepID=A0A2V5J1Z4_9EURO|nr:hypothetical protein BP00DRAFT_181935 [Aspergillus indologenus CBS 114.80]
MQPTSYRVRQVYIVAGGCDSPPHHSETRHDDIRDPTPYILMHEMPRHFWCLNHLIYLLYRMCVWCLVVPSHVSEMARKYMQPSQHHSVTFTESCHAGMQIPQLAQGDERAGISTTVWKARTSSATLQGRLSDGDRVM